MSVRRNSVLIARYGYDVLGRRIVKRVYSSASGGTVGYTRFVYKGSHVSFETDSAGTIGLRYTWGAGTDDVVAITTAAGQHYYVTTDKLGSVRSIAKRDGTWQLSQRFDPYGRLIVRDSASGSTIGAQLRYGWTGREWDAETGFSYHRARYFDPESRRWTQEDPIGYAGGENVYAYVGGSPMEARDPSGAIPSEDGVLRREYDKVPMVAPPTWDGWFGISGTLLSTFFTSVFINYREVARLPGRPSKYSTLASDYAEYAANFEQNRTANEGSGQVALEARGSKFTVGDFWTGTTVMSPDQYVRALAFSLKDEALYARVAGRFSDGNVGVGDNAADFYAKAKGIDPLLVWGGTIGPWSQLRPTLFESGPLHNMVVHESFHAFYPKSSFPDWDERRVCFEANRLNLGRVLCY